MSIWFRRRDQTGRMFYFATELPVAIIIPLIGIVMAVLLGSLLTAPVATLLVCFGIALAGSAMVGIAKWTMFQRRVLISLGSAGLPRGMKVVYRIGWTLVILGIAFTLLSVGVVLRH